MDDLVNLIFQRIVVRLIVVTERKHGDTGHEIQIFLSVGYHCAKFNESCGCYSSSRSIAWSLFGDRSIVVPVRNCIVCFHALHDHVGYVYGKVQEGSVICFAVAGSVSVYSPSLSARP